MKDTWRGNKQFGPNMLTHNTQTWHDKKRNKFNGFSVCVHKFKNSSMWRTAWRIFCHKNSVRCYDASVSLFRWRSWNAIWFMFWVWITRCYAADGVGDNEPPLFLCTTFHLNGIKVLCRSFRRMFTGAFFLGEAIQHIKRKREKNVCYAIVTYGIRATWMAVPFDGVRGHKFSWHIACVLFHKRSRNTMKIRIA